MRILALSILLAGSIGCAGTADFSGEYTLAVSNGPNGCEFMNWDESMTTTGVPMMVTQTEDQLTADVGGGARVALDLILGGHVMNGEGSGEDFEMTLFGTRSATEMGCAYTVNLTASGELDGDTVTGTFAYVPATNGSPDCGVKNSCQTTQSFAGARPPTE